MEVVEKKGNIVCDWKWRPKTAATGGDENRRLSGVTGEWGSAKRVHARWAEA
jgi:hypothetical protein